MINRFENFRYTDSPLTKEDRNGEYMTYGSKKLLKMKKEKAQESSFGSTKNLILTFCNRSLIKSSFIDRALNYSDNVLCIENNIHWGVFDVCTRSENRIFTT